MNTTIAVKDNFSFGRLMGLASFYRPLLLRQLIAYGGASLLFSVLVLLPVGPEIQVGFFTIAWSAMGLMVQLSPVVLAKFGDSRIIERLIPASPIEKFVFFIIYFLIIVPVTVYFLPELALIIYQQIPAVQTSQMMWMISLRYSNPPVLIIINLMSTAASVMTCLYVIMRVRHNRVLWGIISVFLFNIALGIIGAVQGAVNAFSVGFDAARMGEQPDPQQYVKKTLEIMVDAPGFTFVLLAILSIYLISIWCMFYRLLRNSK